MEGELLAKCSTVLEYYAKDQFRNCKLVHMHEFVGHDGCDRWGYKSNLYDLYVWFTDGTNYYVDNWHSEQWYTKNENLSFYIARKYCVTEVGFETSYKRTIEDDVGCYYNLFDKDAIISYDDCY